MLRSALTAALVVAFPTFAADEDPLPAANFSAEAKVVRVTLQPAADDGFAWVEVTFKVTRCIAGPCTRHQSVKVQVPADLWRGDHGSTMGVIGYGWKDNSGAERTWALALALDHGDQQERFERESETAIANAGAPADDSAVATR